jgi:hypothetical protein
MRLCAIAVLLLLSGAADARQGWNEIVEGIARLPLPDQSGEALRQAEIFMGPPPAGSRQRQEHARQVEMQRQLMLEGVASIGREAMQRLRREMEAEDAAQARMRDVDRCRALAPAGARHWDAVHACYASPR